MNARLADEKDPLHEDLKYRYLASALVITKDDPFTLGAEKKVAYFDELLSEIRLQTRVDGPNTVGRDQDFGIIVSVIHTEAMGRVAKFGQYLTQRPRRAVRRQSRKKRRRRSRRKMREAQGPRDELELSLTETLSPFFDIKSITFASPEVKPRPTAQTGWEETVLAYILVRAKDASVDKIPPVADGAEVRGPDRPRDHPGGVRGDGDQGRHRRRAAAPGEQRSRSRRRSTRGSSRSTARCRSRSKPPPADWCPTSINCSISKPLKKAIGVKNDQPARRPAGEGDQHLGRSGRPALRAALDDRARWRPDPRRGRHDGVPFPAAEIERRHRRLPDLRRHESRHAPAAIGEDRARRYGPGKRRRNRHPASPSGWESVPRSRSSAAVLFMFSRNAAPVPNGGPLRRARCFQDAARSGWLRRRRTAPPPAHQPARQPAANRSSEELQQDLQRVQQACFGATGGAMSETDLRSVAEKWLRAAC